MMSGCLMLSDIYIRVIWCMVCDVMMCDVVMLQWYGGMVYGV